MNYTLAVLLIALSICALSKAQGQQAACTTPKPNCALCTTVTINLQLGPVTLEVCTTCNEGFTFDDQQQCVQVANRCEQTPGPCQNNGQCVSITNGFYCHCPSTHAGQRCQFTCGQAIQGCLECFLPLCSKCEDSLIMSPDRKTCQTCEQAISHCTSCAGGRCTACQTGYQLSADGATCEAAVQGGDTAPPVPPGAIVLGDEVISRALAEDGNVGMRLPNPKDYFTSSGTITQFRYYSTGASERIAFFALRGIGMYRYQAIGITWHTPTQAGVQVVPANIPVRAYDSIGYFHTGPNVIPYEVVQCTRDHTATRTAWRVPGDVRDDTGYMLMPEARCVSASLQAVLTAN